MGDSGNLHTRYHKAHDQSWRQVGHSRSGANGYPEAQTNGVHHKSEASEIMGLPKKLMPLKWRATLLTATATCLLLIGSLMQYQKFLAAGLDGSLEAGTADSWPAGCKSKYAQTMHLRTSSVPLDFFWLALHASSENVTLVGPGKTNIPLTKAGTLSLIQQSIYTLSNPGDLTAGKVTPGKYKLFVGTSKKPISTFPLRAPGCFCPEDLSQFSQQYQCSARAVHEVRKSIARWPEKSVTREIYEQPPFYALKETLHLLILDNKLYCKQMEGQHCPLWAEDKGRAAYIVSLIQRVLLRVRIPDVMLMWNLDDMPRLQGYAGHPAFSASGSAFHRDFLLPTPYMVEDKFSGRDIHEALAGLPWEERVPMAYFVGSATGEPLTFDAVPGMYKMNPRLRAAELALERPELLKVKVTMLRSDARNAVLDELVERGVLLRNRVEGTHAKEFKYVLDLPGNSASWRLGGSIGSGALTVKNRTPWNEFWHYLLEEGRNMFYTEDMLGDVFGVVESLQRQDNEAKCVAREAQLLSLLELRQEDLLCWTAHSLVQLSNIMAFQPTINEPDLVELPNLIELTDQSGCNCS